jgi:sulfite exporter TauE/SafE
MFRALSEGFTLGASTGVTCAATCVPFLIPYLMANERKRMSECAPLLFYFLSGRLIAYALFGLVAGWFGAELKPYVSETVRAWSVILTAALLLFSSFGPRLSMKPFCAVSFQKKLSARAPFVLGLLLGLNICPPFLLGVARLVEFGTAFTGVLFFSAFFAASSLYLVPFFVLKPLAAGERVRFVGRIISLLVGIWYLGIGIIALF